MAPTYWLDLFSGETWDEFQKHGAKVSGFRATQKKTAEKVKPGDRFLCYVVGISRFIGVLEVQGATFFDESPIWASDAFPVRFKVKPIVQVPFENAIPVTELRDRLAIFDGSPGINNFGYLFQGSLRKWPQADGDLILSELEREKQFPKNRSVDKKKLYKATAFKNVKTARTDKGEVTVPENDDADAPSHPSKSSEAESITHTEVQWLLLKLGSDMGLNVWVAKNDKSKEFQGRKFAELPRLVKELPHQFTDAVQKTIELIDVLWLKKDAIVGAFEIESTTSIYSGLLRMSDLISMQPNISIPLYIVAPEDRREKVVEEINRPTFASLAKPLSTVCRFITFPDLKEAMEKHQTVLSYLPPDFVWNEVAEVCELEPQ